MSDLTKHGGRPLLAGEERILHVVFRIGESDYMLPAEEILQMESFTGATEVPGAPLHVAGLVQIRGRVVPVIDLRLRFGAAVSEPVLDNRVIVGKHGDRIVGLLVDSARQVVSLTAAQIEAPPQVVERQSSGFVKGVAMVDGRIVMLVDFAKIIGEELNVVA